METRLPPIYVLGLTGSIGSGKSETARIFRRLRFPVSEADEIVRELYAASPLLQEALSNIFPFDHVPFSRSRVATLMMANPFLLDELEKVIHPLVKEEQNKRIKEARERGNKLIVLDVPLLFEAGWEKECDGILVVTCRSEIQKRRVMARAGMTEEKFEILRRRQWSDEKKCAHADFILDTSQGRLHTFMQLRQLLENKCRYL
ncbi:MAG: dephospho-CoA kinase [Caedimonas sp.]|nr:dephospho-CoA kinase [Caedimonas sp.]